jgi:hypothetical protein
MLNGPESLFEYFFEALLSQCFGFTSAYLKSQSELTDLGSFVRNMEPLKRVSGCMF